MGGVRMHYRRLVFIIVSVHLICYGADQDDSNIMASIAKNPTEKDLLQSGRYELFKSILNVYNYAVNINELVSEFPLDKDPNPTHVEGAGLELYIVIDENPIYLCMPWGRLDIDGALFNSPDLARWVTDSFFKNFALSFESHEAELEYRRHNVKVDPLKPVTFYAIGQEGSVRIAEQDLKNYRGTSTLIKSDVRGNYSCYKINAIAGKPLPEQKERDSEASRSLQAISSEWDLLNIMHNREFLLRDRQEASQARKMLLEEERAHNDKT